MDWYGFPVNGQTIIAPLTPAQAEALGANPAGSPAGLAERLGGLFRNLAADLAAVPQGEAEHLVGASGVAAPISASPSCAPAGIGRGVL